MKNGLQKYFPMIRTRTEVLEEIMNPETTPERLESFLSVVLQQNVKIRNILPSDNSRIADESSLLIIP